MIKYPKSKISVIISTTKMDTNLQKPYFQHEYVCSQASHILFKGVCCHVNMYRIAA